MSIEGIFTTGVESTPNYNPTAGVAGASNNNSGNNKNDSGGSKNIADTLSLSPEAKAQVKELQQRDREVRAHEQAHVAAARQYVVGGINYTYTRGPDNKQYATGGSVSLDTSPVAGDPEATLEKARVLRSAALAPGSPSAQDQNVAAQASAMASEARTEKTQEQNEEQGKTPSVEQNNFAANFANVNDVRSPQNTVPSSAVNGSDVISAQAAPHAALGLTNSVTHSPRSVLNNMNTALDAYKNQQRSAFMPSALAPWGTGISLQV